MLIFASVACLLPVLHSLGQSDPPRNGVFVVTNRVADTLPEGEVLFQNRVDEERGLKYLYVTESEGNFYARSFPGLAALLENPAAYRYWAVWVHGDGQTFELSVRRAMEIQALHQVNFIVFAWPTSDPKKGPIGNFRNSRKNALLTIPYFSGFLHEIKDYMDISGNRFTGSGPSMFIHSLGNYLLREATQAGMLDDLPDAMFTNLVINAAAVETEGHAEWVEKLAIQQQIYIAFNDKDVNLEGLRVISSLGMQLGERPLPPLASNALYLDFTESVGFRYPTGATHSYYFGRMTEMDAGIRNLYRKLFQGQAP